MNNIETESPQQLIDRTAKYVRLKLEHEPSGHDWLHIQRVWRISKILQKKEGGNLLLIELAALLHNLMEHNYPLYLEEKPLLALHGMMDILQIEGNLRNDIIEIINDSKYKASETRKPSTVEGRIVQDANWLDSLGAVGVARAFASGGFLGRPMYDPEIKVRTKMDNLTYQRGKKETTSYNYIFEKSMKVVELLNTDTAKVMAKSRVEFMEKFISEFKKESEGDDIPI